MSSPQSELPDFDVLWDYEQPTKTEGAFLALLEQVGQKAPLAYRMELLTQIARTQGLQRRFSEAHATLDQVEATLSEPAVAERITPRLRYLLERGRVYNTSGEPERAKPLFLSAWEEAVASGQDGYAVDAAHMLGIVEPNAAGMEWNRKALELAQASGDPSARRWRGSLYNNMGWAHHEAGEYDEALHRFEAALAAWEADGQTELVPVAKWAVARALRSLGQTQEALSQQLALLEELERAGTRDGYVYEEIGECLLSLGRGDEAQPYFAQAWSLLSQDAGLAEAEPERIARLRTLGVVDTGGAG